MPTKKKKTSFHDALSNEVVADLSAELGEDLNELSKASTRKEAVEAIITRIHRYAAEKLGQPADTDYSTVDPDTIAAIQATTRQTLQILLPHLISDNHREFVVRCHARGLSTSDAVWELITQYSTISRLVQDDAIGLSEFKRFVVPRMAYLKPGAARWPEKKYGAIWREERERHKNQMSDAPLTSSAEQAALLAKHVDRINAMFDDSERTPADWQVLTNSLIKTVESLQKVTVTEQHAPVELPSPQLVGVLERLTLALTASEQHMVGDATDRLVGVLERLTLVLRSPEYEAIASENTNPDEGNPVQGAK